MPVRGLGFEVVLFMQLDFEHSKPSMIFSNMYNAYVIVSELLRGGLHNRVCSDLILQENVMATIRLTGTHAQYNYKA